MAVYSLTGDLELLGLMAQDKQEAFTEIYNRYWKKMLLIAWNHAKEKQNAEDLVHEVFMLLWEKRHTLEIDNLPAYLTTSVKFSIFKYYQRQQRRAVLAQQNYNFVEVTEDEEMLDALFLEEYIRGVVELLPEKCRLTFQYSRVEGLSNAEIASRMNISEKGVEANLTRALKIIRGNLKNTGLLMLIAPSIWKNLF